MTDPTNGASGAAPPPKNDDVYDRQIRLWGADAQGKINKAKVLYVHISGVSAEILKNLVLAGVHADICDGRPFPEAVADTPTSFFTPEELEAKHPTSKSVAHAIQPHVQELNPLLNACQAETRLVEDLPNDYFAQYDIVVASRLGMAQAQRIAAATTKAGGKFYLVDCFGWWGTAVMDLGPEHTFRRELGKDKLSDLTTLSTYVSLANVFQVKLGDATDRFNKTAPPPVWMRYRAILEYQARSNSWPTSDKAEDFCTNTRAWLSKEAPALLEHECMQPDELTQLAGLATAQISPVCAVLGGVIGNELIKAIGGKGEPANNTLLLDGTTGGCQAFLVKP